MARWYVRFDTKSQADLDSDFFNRKNSGISKVIGISSASGALYRDGLISSRSLLQTDVYQDLDAVNRNGGLGVIFPSDLRTTDSATYVSWSNGYTSSLEGIKIPETNAYGQFIYEVNYSKRPTASVSYTASNIVTALSPADPIGVSYQTYTSASNAVYSVLTNIVGGGPYDRLGNNPSRTALSIWHNPALEYFAWDDFTPGTPQNVSANQTYAALPGDPTPNTSASNGEVYLSMSREYLNDFNYYASASIFARLFYASSSGQNFYNFAATLNIKIPVSYLTSSVDSNQLTWRWNPGILSRSLALSNTFEPDTQSSNGLNLVYTVSYWDPILTSSNGPSTTVTKNTGAQCSVNGGPTSTACFIKLGGA